MRQVFVSRESTFDFCDGNVSWSKPKRDRAAMTVIGYARVSTTAQNLDLQLAALKSAGADIIRSEKQSGNLAEVPIFREARLWPAGRRRSASCATPRPTSCITCGCRPWP
jgi:hypothetical protein